MTCCNVIGCSSPSKARGMCNKHYLQWWKSTPKDERDPIPLKDLTGMTFGRLTVVARSGKNKHGDSIWKCKCECGKTLSVAGGHLSSGHTRSCGCLAHDVHVKQLQSHGITTGGKPRTFVVWNGMKARCLNPNSTSYKNYGARGIGICDEWMTFENFHKWAMANGYSDGLQIDRIDNDGDYRPENCRWVSRSENQRNTSRTNMITINGRTQCASDWIRELGISKTTFYRDLRRGQAFFVNKYAGKAMA